MSAVRASEHTFEEFISAVHAKLDETPDEPRVADPEEADAALFLRARNDDIGAAVTQYISAERFYTERKGGRGRTVTGPDPLEVIYRSLCPHANLLPCEDKEGRPVYIECT
eukprot:gene17024-34423_t